MHIRQYLSLLLLLLLGQAAWAAEQPLVYVDAWKRAPYVFINDNGEPDGFNVELIRKVMSRLSIPYEIRLRNQQDTRYLIQKDSADLTLGVATDYSPAYGSFGKEVVCLSENVLLVKKSDSTSVISLQQLRTMPITLANGSRAYRFLINNGMPDSLIHTVENMEQEILRETSSGHVNAVWNKLMICWVLSKYHLSDRYTVQPIGMPAGQYRFMSKDTTLLNNLDSVCRIMRETGELQEMQDRWMTTMALDEPVETTKDSMLNVFFLFGMLTIVLCLMRWYRHRRSSAALTDIRTLMGLTLHANHMQVWTYSPLTRRYSWMSHEGTVDKQFNSFEFSKFYPEEDFNIIHSQVMAFIREGSGSASKILHSYDITDLSHVLDVEVRMEALRDSYGKIYLICGIQYDITGSKAAITRMRQMHARFQTAFDYSFGTFMRFDPEGVLVDINYRCCTALGITDPQKVIDKKYNIRDFGMLKDINLATCPDNIIFSTLSNNASMSEMIPFDHSHDHEFRDFINSSNPADMERYRSMADSIYYTTQLVKSRDKEGNLIGYIMYIEDKTEGVDRFHKNRRKELQAVKLEQEADIVSQRRNFVIEHTSIMMINYSPSTKTFNIYVSNKGWERQLTQLDILEVVDPQNMQKIFKILHRVDALENTDIHFSVNTILRNSAGQQRQFNVDAHPVYSDEGQVESYFGIMREITREITVRTNLKRESKKAHEAERLRQNFLKNMSYSIRQPLVTIQQNIEVLARADDMIMTSNSLKNITTNSNRLIMLSDDTLLLSRVEARLMKESRKQVDLVPIFNKVINDCIDRNRHDTVKYNVVETYDKFVAMVDEEVVSRIMKEVVSLSARHTTYGTLNVRYMYRKGSLSIAVESTGQTISPNMLQHIFEPRIGDAYTTETHNIHLSGLEMPICKALVDMLHGTIDIDSDPGRGTVIYVTLPMEEIKA